MLFAEQSFHGSSEYPIPRPAEAEGQISVDAHGLGDASEAVTAQQFRESSLQYGDLLRPRYMSDEMNMMSEEPARIFS